MVVLADFRSTDAFHFEINRFYVDLYKSRLGQAVHVFAERGHLSALQEACPIDRGAPFLFYRPYSKSRIVRMYLLEVATILRLMRVFIHAKRNRATLLHILNVSPLSHNFARVLLKALPPGCPILLCIHGELESVVKVERRFWKLPFWFPMSLGIKVKNLYPVVLGNNIRSKMEAMSGRARDWIAIEHPYSFLAPGATRRQAKPYLSIGSVGVASVAKGSELIFRLAERFKDEVEAGRICFKVVGRLDPSMEPYLNPLVQFRDPQVFYDREAFDREVRALDAVLYCYPEDSYQLTASGSLFDAIRFNKPILATRNEYFEWVLRDASGDCVVWIKDLDQVEGVLRGWLAHGPPTVDDLLYDSIRARHSPGSVGCEFVKQLRERAGLFEGR